MLLRVEAPTFVAGLVLFDGRVYRAAPILGYMRSWTEAVVRGHCARRRWAVERIGR